MRQLHTESSIVFRVESWRDNGLLGQPRVTIPPGPDLGHYLCERRYLLFYTVHPSDLVSSVFLWVSSKALQLWLWREGGRVVDSSILITWWRWIGHAPLPKELIMVVYFLYKCAFLGDPNLSLMNCLSEASVQVVEITGGCSSCFCLVWRACSDIGDKTLIKLFEIGNYGPWCVDLNLSLC